jgi:transcriptional regulator with XRE-family HTH domain
VPGKKRISGRDELSRALLALREAAELSQVDAGRLAQISQRKVSRFEAGLYVPNEDELAALLTAYHVSGPEHSRVHDLAATRRNEGRKPRAVIRRLNAAAIQHDIRLLEEKANGIEAFHPSTVLGLLQTPGYMRGVWGDDEDAEDAIAQRQERQRQLTQRDQRCTFIQTEGSLRWQVGNPQIMVEQLDAIAAAADRPGNIRVGIIPWSQPLDFTVVDGFHLYDRDTVNVGTTAGSILLTDQADLDDYVPLFDRIARSAVYGTDAAAAATRIAEDYRKLLKQ